MHYALYFVPHELEREKLALLRRQLCKRFENRKAVMYPVHLTLVRELSFRDYKAFMRALERHCAAQKPFRIKLAARLATRESWGGVEVERSQALTRLQEGLVALCAAQGEVVPSAFDPHISLVYAKRLPSLAGRTSPVKHVDVDRVSLVLQTAPGTPFRIVKHIPFGN